MIAWRVWGRLAACCCLAGVVTQGCGDEDGGTRSDITPADAQTRVRSMIESTAAAIAGGLSITPKPDALLPSACLSDSGKDLGSTTFPYSVELGIDTSTDVAALFDRTHDHWEAQGYEIEDADLPATGLATLHAERDDYGFVLAVDQKLIRAHIDGSSPCVKDPGRDSG